MTNVAIRFIPASLVRYLIFSASSAILHAADAGFNGTMSTAEHFALCFTPVPDNPAAAVRAGGRQRRYSAFKTVIEMGPAIDDYFKRFIIYVSALFTFLHNRLTPSVIRAVVLS